MSLTDKFKKRGEGEAGHTQAAALMERMQDDMRDRDAVILLCTQIEVDEQAREELGDLKPLAESIKEHGQMNAVVVLPTANPHKFKLSKGERRYFAIRDELQRETIRATIDRSGVQDDRVKHRIGQLHENIHRKDYEPFELAKEFAALIEETGWTHEQLALKVGVTKGWVSKKLSLLKAPPEIQAAIRSGEMAETDYYNNKAEKEAVATKRNKPGEGEGGGADRPKLPKKFAMPWEDAAALGSLLIGFLRADRPADFGSFTISEASSPEEVAAFFDAVKNTWYPKA